MKNFETMDYVIIIAVLCYGIYLTVQNARLLYKNIRIRKEYLETHKDYTMVNQYIPYALFFSMIAVVGVVGAIVGPKDTKEDWYVCFALVLMLIIATGMVFDSIVKRRAIVDKDGFVYEKMYYRYRGIISMNPMKSIIKNIDILTVEKQHIVVSKKMGTYLHDCFLEWKNRKKKKIK